MQATARKLRRLGKRKPPKRVSADSYFTKKHTEGRKLHDPVYAKKRDTDRKARLDAEHAARAARA